MSAALPECTTLLIVFHSRTGGAQQMAQAAQAGALQEPNVCVRLLPAEHTQPQDVLAAHGYLFACPENLASMSGPMKDFFERCYYPVLGQIDARPYASLICAGSDGSGAARQIARIATGWRLHAVAQPLIVCTHAQTPQAIAAPKHLAPTELAACRDLGQALAAGLALGIF